MTKEEAQRQVNEVIGQLQELWGIIDNIYCRANTNCSINEVYDMISEIESDAYNAKDELSCLTDELESISIEDIEEERQKLSIEKQNLENINKQLLAEIETLKLNIRNLTIRDSNE